GLFKQTFTDGFQTEEGDDWQKWGDPWGIERTDEAEQVDFADFSVLAVPFDTPVIGYKNGVVNTLRLWESRPLKCFDFGAFDSMQGEKIAKDNFKAEQITDVLYPNDNTEEGKLLRLRQQYFMVSASLKSIIKDMKRNGVSLEKLPTRRVFQLNDTHPVLAIPELIRLLMAEGIKFAKAFDICRRAFNFTNHTILGEALERWQGKMVRAILPEIWEICKKIQKKAEKELGDDNLFIIKDDVVYMANLAIFVGFKVNGVAEIHTSILKESTFKDWYGVYPEKFVNITNGITPRRWFLLNNPKMAKEITDRIGDGWHTNLEEISKIKPYIHDEGFRKAFVEIKRENKRRLADYIYENEGIRIPEHFIFDIQIKRLHEYKRQLMNAFGILYTYFGIKDGSIKDFKPTAYIFGAKSAPGYYMAKAIIKYINEIAKLINSDAEVADKMKVVFVHNYNVSYAEKLVCAADISEQISLAGMEASGTGNMKFMLNGTVTLGTLDGANVEICQEAGIDNNYIFGATVDEVAALRGSYSPKAIIEGDPLIKRVVSTLIDGTFNDNGTGVLESIYLNLTEGYSPDYFMVLNDLRSFIDKRAELCRDFGSEEFTTKCLENMANAGKFTSDRSVKEYAEIIWRVK
ncbi:MAG: glycogen/starch/alpha-glucan phosphorylase, partial [Clostridia bacterium]|nr:glycogen/starch/alpha-glucan phosphorylase [Clostridia bacterium]